MTKSSTLTKCIAMSCSIFGGGFKASKCKTLLRLAMARVKLLRNKRDSQVKQMRKDIAQLLSSKQEASARIRVEHVAREQNIIAGYDLIELFCELIIVRLPIIESQKVCPPDLKEAIASLIFASPRCADLPELLQLRTLFESKYGKEFGAGAAELRPECGVNRRLVEKLSVRAPPGEIKLALLTEIASEHGLSWDAAESAAELLKLPDDLLQGPGKFFAASAMPLSEPDLLSNEQNEARKPLPPRVLHPRRSSLEPEVRTFPADSARQLQARVPSAKVPFNTRLSAANEQNQNGYENPANYENINAAANAAAESANRAVAAARAAAHLAKSYPSKRDSSSSDDSEGEKRFVRERKEQNGRLLRPNYSQYSQDKSVEYHR